MKSNSLGGVARQRSMGGPGPRPIEVSKVIIVCKSIPQSKKCLFRKKSKAHHLIRFFFSLYPFSPQNFFPQVPDASTQTIMMMQRQMEAMASELKQLRTKVMQSEVKNDLEFQR